MSPAADDTLARMRGDWDRRAREDHKLHIATGHSGSEEVFRASGLQDLDGIVLDGVILSPAAEILEIGCGVGRLLLPLARQVRAAHGVDISPVMVAKSKAYTAGTPNVHTTLTDGSLSQFPDASLDFVFSFIVFQHIPDRAPIRRYVEEAARVLRPGGVFRFQLDGRWWWTHGKGGPDTYDGVKFSPDDTRVLLAGTRLAMVDEWGAEGHYDWITTKKAGQGAAVSLRLREWDVPLLESLLGRLGSKSPRADAGEIRHGTPSLRPHLLALVDRFTAAGDTTFVVEAYRALLGRPLDEAGRGFHVEILRRGFEDRAALLDTIATSRGFLDMVRPHAPEIPWFVACEILMRLGKPPGPAAFFDLVGLVEASLEGRSGVDAIRLSFRSVLGYEPDEAALAHHLSLIEGHPDGRRLMVRELLASRKSPEPPAREEAATPRLPGESVPGEAARAVRVLEEGLALDDRGFVRLAYERIFRREADAGGEEFYSGKLASSELSRAGLLRELLWSEEAQGAQTNARVG
ncbi:MAG: methyltransferase domain-containing protein [Thermoanaerobaculia bacterium]